METTVPAPGEVYTTPRGGRQSYVPERFDLVPPGTLARVARVLGDAAAKYGAWNALRIDPQDHVNHAVAHVYKALEGDTSEPHLVNAICRLMFAEMLTYKEPADENLIDQEDTPTPERPRTAGAGLRLLEEPEPLDAR